MNTRQKKKQYKKRYGHNPPKGADGRYLFHVTYGLDLAAGQDHSGTLTPGQVEALTKIQALTPEDAERIRNSFCEAAAIAAQALADFAAAISQGFSNMADMLSHLRTAENKIIILRAVKFRPEALYLLQKRAFYHEQMADIVYAGQ